MTVFIPGLGPSLSIILSFMTAAVPKLSLFPHICSENVVFLITTMLKLTLLKLVAFHFRLLCGSKGGYNSFRAGLEHEQDRENASF